MSKRSTRVARRNEAENAIREIEEKIRSRSGKNPAGVAPEATVGTDGRDGESGEVDLPKAGERSVPALRRSFRGKIKGKVKSDGQECPSDTSIPQGLKPAFQSDLTARLKVVPFPNISRICASLQKVR
jgi:hypothetical protein